MRRAWVGGTFVMGLALVACAPAASDVSETAETLQGTSPTATVLLAPATEDVSVRQIHPNDNFGSMPLSVVADTTSARESYLKFTVSGLPSGATVTSARIQLHVDPGGGSSDGPRIYRTPTTSWSEAQMTWNTRPGITGSPLANLGAVAESTTVELDVTPAIPGNGTYSFTLLGDSAQIFIASSKEEAKPPRLVIVYSLSSRFVVAEDVSVRQLHPDDNYGTFPLSVVPDSTGARESYLKFVVGGLPPGAVLTAARVRLWVEAGSTTPNGPKIYDTPTTSWSESQMTWHTKPGATGTALDDLGAASELTWVELNVRGAVGGNGTFSFTLLGDGLPTFIADSRSDHHPPELVVDEQVMACSGVPGTDCPDNCANGPVTSICTCDGWVLTSGFCCTGPCCSGRQGGGSCTAPECGGTCQAQVPATLPAKQTLVIDGTSVVDTTTGVTGAVSLPTASAIALRYTNNRVTAQNSAGYILLAGTEAPSARDHDLDGSVITGNFLNWLGTDPTSVTHGLFVGYGVNQLIEYNYLKNDPYGVVTKSSGMTATGGAVAYNIVTGSVIGVVVKGINGVRIYNNTFYDERSPGTAAALVHIYENTDLGSPGPASTHAQVLNNIFYTRFPIPNIMLSQSSRDGFQSDYNVFYCETGAPVFVVEGIGTLTFGEWQALGYDAHSVVVDPRFVDTESLIPAAPVDHGTDLGPDWRAGLSPTTVWGSTPVTVDQGATWQCGAYVVL